MTKPERLLAVVGVGVIASAVLLTMYVRQSNPADAQSAGCGSQRSRLAQTLDQVRFSTSASHAVSTAIADTSKTRDQYLGMIEATRQKIAQSRLPSDRLGGVRSDLAQASWILNGQGTPLLQAQAVLAQEQREMSSAAPLVREASLDLREDDCTALSLTLSRSGWPKDRLLLELSDAARLNSQVSDNLESALSLILRAQHELHA